MSNVASKKNISSTQVLKTLQLLLEDNYTMSELVEKLNKNEPEPVFNNSVVSKYINTCRYCGFDIHKIHNRYFVSSVPFGMSLISDDIDLIEKMQEVAKNIFSSKVLGKFNAIISNISKYSNKQLVRVEQKTAEITKELFQKAIDENRYVSVFFKVKAVRLCRPISIVMEKNRPCFNVIYNGKMRTIPISRVTGIIVQDSKFLTSEVETQLVYRIYEPLASRYDLKENEEMTEKNNNYIVISNKGEPKDVLYSRLLRYDSLCEIITDNYRKEMKKIIADTLANYGEHNESCC